jgi:hypothetical protein
MESEQGRSESWPELPYGEWRDTCATFHMWLQIVGKVRTALAPWTNHQWHVTLHLTSRGFTTRPIFYDAGAFQLDVDVVDHVLKISTSNGREGRVVLEPRTVADFYRALLGELESLGIAVRIHGLPNEVPDPLPFADNERDRSYDGEYVNRFWRVLLSSAGVFDEFRGDFIGKCSPVHFFWGGMDLAVTRFSGRGAPEHPGGIPNLPDWITREAYSHEVSSAGFWPGGDSHPHPMYYSYAYPSPEGFSGVEVGPASAKWHGDLSEFVLPYDDVRQAAKPEQEVRTFLQSTYEAAANLGEWDRGALEWGPGQRPSARSAHQPRRLR